MFVVEAFRFKCRSILELEVVGDALEMELASTAKGDNCVFWEDSIT